MQQEFLNSVTELEKLEKKNTKLLIKMGELQLKIVRLEKRNRYLEAVLIDMEADTVENEEENIMRE